MRNEKLVEATMLALRGKLNESASRVLDKNKIAEFLKNAIKELTTTDYTCTWYDLDKDLAIFVGWTEGYDPEDTDYIHSENDPSYVIASKIASTHEYMKTDLDWLVQPYYEDGEVWDTEITLNNNSNFTEDADWFIKSYKDIREALDRGELLLENKKQEVKGSSKTYTCIEDRQHGDFCVGATMTAEEWGETAMGWADSDGWSDPEEPLLKNFKTEQDCINFIDDMWEITIVPSDDPKAKEFLGEARSHKEDNEKAAPRNDKDIFGNNINNFRKNTFHTTDTSILDKNDLAKRYKTGKKDYMNNDEYVIPNDEYTDTTNKYKYARQTAKDFAKSVDYYENEIKAGNSVNKNSLATVRGLRNKCSKEANDILKQMRNKTKNTEARSHKEDNEKAAPRTIVNHNGREVKTRNMINVSNPKVGNNSYHNEKGSQYLGTTEAEYASKRNKTGKRNEFGYDVYLADTDTIRTPVKDFQNDKTQANLIGADLDKIREKERTARKNKEYWKSIGDNVENQVNKYNQRATDIVNKERERIANKENKEEARSHKEDNERVAPRIAKYSGERVFGELDNVPKRARYNKSKDTNWGYFNDEEANTYENGTDSIMQYKTYKTDAESERALARYHNANAQQRDNMASDIVRDKKLNRAKRTLNNQENKKETEARSHKEDNENKTETKNDIMSFEDWVDYIDIKKEYPEWFKDKQELDRPFLDVIGDHMDELNRDYRKYKKSQSKKKVESIKLENVQGNNQGICPKCGSMITNYGEIFWDDNGIGQVFDCTNPKCKAHGIEYYNTTFDYIEIED